MGKWWNKSELYLTDYRTPPGSAYDFILENETTEILLTPRTFVTVLNSSKVGNDEELAAILAGEPFDSANRSTANLYYTVVDYDQNENYWVYNFNHFYSWNGCSNQAIALSINGTKEVRYICRYSQSCDIITRKLSYEDASIRIRVLQYFLFPSYGQGSCGLLSGLIKSLIFYMQSVVLIMMDA